MPIAPGEIRVRVPAHAANEAVSLLQGRAKVRVLERSDPFFLQPEPACEECKATDDWNGEAIKEHAAAERALNLLLHEFEVEMDSNSWTEVHRALDDVRPHHRWIRHRHYRGDSRWFVELVGVADPTIRVKGKATGEREFQNRCRDADAANTYAALMASRTAGVDSEPRGGASVPPVRPLVAINMNELRAAIRVCSPARQKYGEFTRRNLQGIALQTRPDGSIRLQACDGHRLAWYALQGPEGLPENEIILDPVWCDGVAKLKRPQGDAIVAEQQWRDEDEKERIGLVAMLPDGSLSPRIDAKAPNYEQVIPSLEHCQWHVTVALSALRTNLAMLSKTTADKIKPVKLQVAWRQTLQLSTEKAEYGDAGGEIPLTGYEGPDEPMAVGINAKFLQELLRPYEATVVTLSFGGALHPIRIGIPGLPQLGMVLMPLRLEW